MFSIGKRFVRRQWGWYLVLLDRRHFKVKLLRFRKNKSCSYQFHYHRNELWLFLTGSRSGSYMSVPRQQVHHYTGPAYVLEIQYGDKCLEEDIVRV